MTFDDATRILLVLVAAYVMVRGPDWLRRFFVVSFGAWAAVAVLVLVVVAVTA